MRRRRAEKRAKRQRAKRRARLRREEVRDPFFHKPDWWLKGLEKTPTEEIVATLAGLGIHTDQVRFRELATAHGNVDGLAEAWLSQSTATGLWEDYPWLAARALWPRWVPDLFSIEVFVKQNLSPDVFRENDPKTPEDGRRHWQAAQAVMDLIAPPEGPARPDLLEELEKHSDLDIGFWLVELPFSLASLDMVDEAVELCARLAPVCEAENLLGDHAVILAEAGRREEALRQVEANLAQFPDDVWIRIKAGDVHRQLGDLAAAEALYRQALAMTDETGPSYDRDGAVERLLDLFDGMGRGAEADALVEDEEARAAELEKSQDDDPFEELDPGPPVTWPETFRREGPKVGRNEPCPCGSGKKFKRCCGR